MWSLIICALNFIINLRIARHNICISSLLLQNCLRWKMQVNWIKYILLVLKMSELFNLSILIMLHIVVNVALFDDATQNLVFNVLVLDVWNQHVLTQSEPHIRHVHYHHCNFFFSDFLVVSDIENLENVFVLLCTRRPA